ncbi:MAG TPA: hypothetical protein VFG33_24210 [Kribbella sp.]|uniref:hypothetical protein n=1 Tax=Kribbella sp. TaxID=1871183 RepID=UPI002D787B78|nr:hypothetical protein [Kribbella sp.]HET6296512.1 hypothetical protein [Kribbella sp.]
MTRLYHVSSSRNRGSIEAHGLDWSFMTTAAGIAGSPKPEVDGVFVCLDRSTVDFFVRANNTGGPVDVWAIDDVDQSDLVETASGFSYLPACIGPEHLTLIDQDLQPISQDDDDARSSTPNRLRRPGHDGEQAMTGDSHDG